MNLNHNFNELELSSSGTASDSCSRSPEIQPKLGWQGVATWEKNIARLCDKWCEKKGAAFDVVEMSENTKVPTTSLKKLSQFSFTLSQHFRNEHRPIQHAAQGSQGGSNGLMIYAGMTHLVDSCLEGSEPGL